MAKKAKGKKGRGKKIDEKKELAEWKKKELQKVWDSFLSQSDEFEAHLNSICENTCTTIRKMYSDKLKSIPENIRSKTVSEYMQMQKDSDTKSCEPKDNDIRSLFEKQKLLSEKKKTLKQSRLERKRSVSVCSSIKRAPLPNANPLANFRNSRVLSESCLNTPLSKRSVAPTSVVTPKFNPRIPLNKNHLRKPRVGEILMSLSGSPLQNVVEDIPDKPDLVLSLKRIKMTTATEIDDLKKKLDDETKSTLQDVKQKLERILQS